MSFRRFCTIIITGMLLLGGLACGGKIPVEPAPKAQGEEAFSKAEALYEQGNGKKALEAYLAYVDQFPKTPYTPAALRKIGSLYMEMGDPARAREVYARLMKDFPGSSFALDAEVEILATLIYEEKYIQLLEWNRGMGEKPFTQAQSLRIAMMKAEALLATGERLDAVTEWFKARSLDPTAEGRSAIDVKIKEGMEGLSDLEIQALTARLIDPEDVKRMTTLREATTFNQDLVVCLLPLSGEYKDIGERSLKGIELAFSQWMSTNSPGLRMAVRDMGGDEKKTAAVMEKVVAERPACIIGPVMAAEQAARIAQANGIPMITLSPKEGITGIGEYVFRNFITPELQARALAAHAGFTLGAKKFAILFPKEKFGETYRNAFFNEVRNAGGEVVAMEGYSPGLEDLSGPIKRLSAIWKSVPATGPQNPGPAGMEAGGTVTPSPAFDALFIPESAKKSALIIPQLRYYDIKEVLLLGTNLWHSPEFLKEAGKDLEGAVFTEGFFEGSLSLQVDRFVKDFTAAYGASPRFIEAVAYDTACMVFQTLTRQRYRQRQDIKEALLHMEPFNGVTGITTFAPNGEAEKKLYLIAIEGGRFVERMP